MDDNNKKEGWGITLTIAANSFNARIDREHEEIIRKAAKNVNTKFNALMAKQPKLGKERALAIIAYEFALDALRAEKSNDTAPYTAKIKELTDVLEEYFKKP